MRIDENALSVAQPTFLSVENLFPQSGGVASARKPSATGAGFSS
jgi:hypothetical protein